MAERWENVLKVDPNYAPEVGLLVAMMQDTRRRTQSLLAELSDDLVDWHAPGVANTIGSLLYHIAVVELDWLYDDMFGEEFPAEASAWLPHNMRDDSGQLSNLAGETLAQHIARLDWVRGLLLAKLRPMSAEWLRTARSLPRYDVTPEWTLHHLMQHEAEHRGQIQAIRALATNTPLE